MPLVVSEFTDTLRSASRVWRSLMIYKTLPTCFKSSRIWYTETGSRNRIALNCLKILVLKGLKGYRHAATFPYKCRNSGTASLLFNTSSKFNNYVTRINHLRNTVCDAVEFEHRVKAWVRLLTSVYQTKDVTPYIHSFANNTWTSMFLNSLFFQDLLSHAISISWCLCPHTSETESSCTGHWETAHKL